MVEKKRNLRRKEEYFPRNPLLLLSPGLKSTRGNIPWLTLLQKEVTEDILCRIILKKICEFTFPSPLLPYLAISETGEQRKLLGKPARDNHERNQAKKV